MLIPVASAHDENNDESHKKKSGLGSLFKPLKNIFRPALVEPKKPPAFTEGSDCKKCIKMVKKYSIKKEKYDREVERRAEKENQSDEADE